MAKIKRKVTQNFTTVLNTFLQDKNLKLKERGLLMTMLALPDNWDYSVKGLSEILPENKDTINKIINSLEVKGYMQRTKITDEKGRVVDWLYEFCDEPIFLEDVKEPHPKNSDMEKPHPKNSDMEKPDMDISDTDNSDIYKYTNKSNTNKSNTNQFNSIHISDEEIETKRTELMNRMNYNNFSIVDQAKLNELIDNLLSEVYYTTRDYIELGNREYSDNKPRALVVNQIEKNISYGTALNYIDAMNKVSGTINNPSRYILKTFYSKCVGGRTQAQAQAYYR